LAIQISMLLAMPLMAVFLFISPQLAAWYISYVVLFNILIGPVFSAGSVTSERERQTLDMLITTVITPWQLLWGKLISGLRVSSVLTAFLVWPMFLAILLNTMTSDSWHSLPTMLAYLVIFAVTCLTTAMIALFFSTVCKQTGTSLMVTYSVILLLYVAPLAAMFFGNTYYPATQATKVVNIISATSPFAAAHNLPLYVDDYAADGSRGWEPAGAGEVSFLSYPLEDLVHFGCYLLFAVLLNVGLFVTMILIFNSRWRISSNSN
jgi:ABC-type transport system involved in multi-copper enzyme maturation permease subunit